MMAVRRVGILQRDDVGTRRENFSTGLNHVLSKWGRIPSHVMRQQMQHRFTVLIYNPPN